MKNIVALGLVALFVGSIGCAAESSEPDEREKSEQVASPLISGGGGSSGLGYCGATVDCENKCADMYPKDASAQSLCKRIEKCSSKCSDVGLVFH